MKRIILTFAFCATCFMLQAQSKDKPRLKEVKTEYSFLWGLFSSKDYPKEKKVNVHIEKPKFSESPKDTTLRTINYKKRSFLGGVIQWTEKTRQGSLSVSENSH